MVRHHVAISVTSGPPHRAQRLLFPRRVLSVSSIVLGHDALPPQSSLLNLPNSVKFPESSGTSEVQIFVHALKNRSEPQSSALMFITLLATESRMSALFRLDTRLLFFWGGAFSHRSWAWFAIAPSIPHAGYWFLI